MSLLRGRVPGEAAEYAASAWDRLYPLAYSLTGRPADAEDLVQDALVTVMTKWERVAAAGHVDAYVRQILVRAFLSRRRRRSSSELPSDEAGLQAAMPAPSGDPMDAVADRQALWSGLAVLSERQRAVLVLRYYEDIPDAAIAELLGLTVGNVRVVAHRALAALRESAGATGVLDRHP